MKLDPERPLELYARAEKEVWSVAALRFDDEEAHWRGLPAFSRAEISSTVASLAFGEEVVTQTLPLLIHAAPTRAQRLFLCTQAADEARHSLFFERWMSVVEPSQTAGGSGKWIEGCRERSPSGLRTLLDETLPAHTNHVRVEPADAASWYCSVLLYHLLLEGIALSAFRSLAQMTRALGKLPALEEGLRGVIRDETRHVAFGVDATANGVANGHRERLVALLREEVPMTAKRLVQPERANGPLLFPQLSEARAERMWTEWSAARAALSSRLSAAGLIEAANDLPALWDSAIERGFEEHEARHGKPHVASLFRQDA